MPRFGGQSMLGRTATYVVAASNSARPYGADFVCDGEGSDEVIIQAALDALPANGGTVLLLDGTYTTGAVFSVRANEALIGQYAGTRIVGAHTGNVVNLLGSNANIANLFIDGNSQARTGLRVSGATITYSRCENIRIINCQYGLELDASSFPIYWNTFKQIQINGCTLKGLWMYGARTAIGDVNSPNANYFEDFQIINSITEEGVYVEQGSFMNTFNHINVNPGTGAAVCWRFGSHAANNIVLSAYTETSAVIDNFQSDAGATGNVVFALAVSAGNFHTDNSGNTDNFFMRLNEHNATSTWRLPQTVIRSTQSSTSTSTGSLTTGGGVGIGENIYAAGDASFSNYKMTHLNFPAVAENTTKQYFTIVMNAVTRPTHVYVVGLHRAVSQAARNNSFYLECMISRESASTVCTVIRNGSFDSSASGGSFTVPTVSGSTVTFGANSPNNGTGTTNNVFDFYIFTHRHDTLTLTALDGQTDHASSQYPRNTMGFYSQVFNITPNGIVTGGTSLNASAIGQFDSTTRGVLPPRMTTEQRDAIGSPATGLMVYNTSTNALNLYTGAAWAALATV